MVEVRIGLLTFEKQSVSYRRKGRESFSTSDYSYQTECIGTPLLLLKSRQNIAHINEVSTVKMLNGNLPFPSQTSCANFRLFFSFFCVCKAFTPGSTKKLIPSNFRIMIERTQFVLTGPPLRELTTLPKPNGRLAKGHSTQFFLLSLAFRPSMQRSLSSCFTKQLYNLH